MSIDRLPTIPQDKFPRKALEMSINEKFPKSVYNVSGTKFEIFFYTPPQIYFSQKSKEKKLAEKRDNKTGEQNRYDLFSDLYDWGSSTGRHQPVVTMVVNPKTGQTAASAAGNVAMAVLSVGVGVSYYGNETYEFKSDVKDVIIRRGNKEVLPYTSSFQYTTLDFRSVGYYGSKKGEDMAQQAIFKLPIEAFSPDERSGKFVPLSISVRNYKDDKLELISIPMNTIYKISSDFREYTGNWLGKQLYKAPPAGCS